jgi:hypothetical protein
METKFVKVVHGNAAHMVGLYAGEASVPPYEPLTTMEVHTCKVFIMM